MELDGDVSSAAIDGEVLVTLYWDAMAARRKMVFDILNEKMNSVPTAAVVPSRDDPEFYGMTNEEIDSEIREIKTRNFWVKV